VQTDVYRAMSLAREPAHLLKIAPDDDLARRLWAPLTRYFSARARRGADVEDLVQEVFLRLARRVGDAPVEAAEGYVFAIANSVLADSYRRAARQLPAAPDDLDGEGPRGLAEDRSPERVLLAREELGAVERALLELPERTRFAFALNRYEELTYQEIARRLGISVSAVEKHMMRALAHLARRRREL
jgi:RNA polymerase sigma factor (sigma-70 family)